MNINVVWSKDSVKSLDEICGNEGNFEPENSFISELD